MHLRKRSRTISTLVDRVRFTRSRGSCPSCHTVVYWVDREVRLTRSHGTSRGMSALHALCAASWGYARSAAEIVTRLTGVTTPVMSVYRNVNKPDADGVMIHRDASYEMRTLSERSFTLA